MTRTEAIVWLRARVQITKTDPLIGDLVALIAEERAAERSRCADKLRREARRLGESTDIMTASYGPPIMHRAADVLEQNDLLRAAGVTKEK